MVLVAFRGDFLIEHHFLIGGEALVEGGVLKELELLGVGHVGRVAGGFFGFGKVAATGVLASRFRR